MKGIEIFCASQASTAVCSAVEQPSPPLSSSQSGSAGAGRAIDRHNPIISDTRRRSFSTTSRTFPNPLCSNSQYSPINPQPYHQLHKIGFHLDGADQIAAVDSATQKGPKMTKKKNSDGVKKSSSIIRTDIVRWSCTKPGDMVTPPGSTRYLLNDKSFHNASLTVRPDEGDTKITPNLENREELSKTTSEISSSSLSLSLSSSSQHCEISSSSSNQVVVLRVSLHCRGCEGKLRKHLSKMEGVTSFKIDFAAKKVTIIGNITPESVLERVSKVKNAQFWKISDPTQTIGLIQ